MAGPQSVVFTDVNALPLVSAAAAQKIKQAAGINLGANPIARLQPSPAPIATKPGVERWPVKTGQDPDRVLVGGNVVGGASLGAGIVPTTVEELASAPRPSDMPDPTAIYDTYQSRRAAPVETTVWQVDGRITVLKLESDGDYHLVLQGASGATMIVEIPTPTTPFIGDCPWSANIAAARAAADAKFLPALARQAFIMLAGKRVPAASLI
ncbi:MAG: hypothetical protein JOZ27_05935, partial [Caulobacteraceae bacterium]|nr:hypothetical protein [Caulobacteraceae bacterium]